MADNKLLELCQKHGITITSEFVRSPPAGKDWKLDPHATEWAVMLHFGDREISGPYCMGSAHTQPPEVDDVLGCMVLDRQCYVNAGSFEDFCAELGYDTDSRRAEAAYHACGETAAEVEAFLGDLLPEFEEAAAEH